MAFYSTNCFGSGTGGIPLSPLTDGTAGANSIFTNDFVDASRHGWLPLQWEVELQLGLDYKDPRDVCGNAFTDIAGDPIFDGATEYGIAQTAYLPEGGPQSGGDYTAFVPDDWGYVDTVATPFTAVVSTFGGGVYELVAIGSFRVELARFKTENGGLYYAVCSASVDVELDIVLAGTSTHAAIDLYGLSPEEGYECGEGHDVRTLQQTIEGPWTVHLETYGTGDTAIGGLVLTDDDDVTYAGTDLIGNIDLGIAYRVNALITAKWYVTQSPPG